MATHSTISALQPDGTVKSIYCHNDGYLSHNGMILIDNYRGQGKIDKLMILGDISSLGEKVEPDPSEPHDFDDPQDDVCVAYHRDRDEAFRMDNYDSIKQYQKIGASEEYNYFWDGSKWMVFSSKGLLIELTTEMVKEDGK